MQGSVSQSTAIEGLNSPNATFELETTLSWAATDTVNAESENDYTTEYTGSHNHIVYHRQTK